jgi:hypothetical protein
VRSLPAIVLAAALGLASVARGDPPVQVRRQTDLAPFSLMDGDTLGDHRLAFGFGAGFPYVQAMAAYNATDGLDLDVNIDSLYGVATVFSFGPKLRVVHDGGVALAVELQGQACWFRKAAISDQATRQLIGTRNFDFQPQIILSYKGRYGALFGSVSYQGTFDTEPISQSPLGGNPGPWSYGSNVGLHMGLELIPFGVVHGYAVLGLDFHTRSGDDVVVPLAEFGLTFPS